MAVPMLVGERTIDVPAGARSGDEIVVRGCGVQIIGRPSTPRSGPDATARTVGSHDLAATPWRRGRPGRRRRANATGRQGPASSPGDLKRRGRLARRAAGDGPAISVRSPPRSGGLPKSAPSTAQRPPSRRVGTDLSAANSLARSQKAAHDERRRRLRPGKPHLREGEGLNCRPGRATVRRCFSCVMSATLSGSTRRTGGSTYREPRIRGHLRSPGYRARSAAAHPAGLHERRSSRPGGKAT